MSFEAPAAIPSKFQAERTPNLAMVTDRVPANFDNVVDHEISDTEQHFPLQLTGLITPGTELDDFNNAVFLRMRLLEKHLGGGMIASPVTRNDVYFGEMVYVHPATLRQINYSHAPYDAKALREEPGAREAYTRQIMSEVKSSGADTFFTDNLKIVLDACVAELGIPIVNVHPSPLPLFKGFRPERRAYDAGDLDSLGYTFHMLASELDAGATLFMQKVAPPNGDAEQSTTAKGRDDHLEEQLRIRNIVAQSAYTPRVLAIVASNVPRKILQGEVAFAAEGRPDFIDDPRYRAQLKEEAEQQGVAEKDLQPYARLVFDMHGTDDYKTLEEILGAPAVADPRIQTGFRTYEVTVPDGSTWGQLVDLTIENGGHHNSRAINTGNGFVMTLTGSVELGKELTARGFKFTTDPHPSRVNAKRDQVVGVPVGEYPF